MPGPGREIEVRLYRDGLSTPWGFRLHGGKDLKAPLTVQKVAVGSPVFGELQRDDMILEIQKCDATHMTHKQAQDLIRNAGGSMLVRVRRSGRQESAMPGNAAIYDNKQLQKGFMLGRVKDSLSTAAGDHGTAPYYGYGSNNYSDYSPTSSHTSGDSNTKTWNRPQPRRGPTIMPLSDPGWTPECLRQPRQRPVKITAPPPGAHDPRHHQHYPVVQPPIRHNDSGPPAWYGSLRASSDAHRSDSEVAGFKRSASPERQPSYATPAPQWAPVAAAAPFEPQGNASGLKNLQYNTPMGLYSKANVNEALAGQMSGLSTNETATSEHDSDVYRLVQDNDRHSRPHRSANQQHGGRLHAPAASDESIRQSPSIRVLESRFVHPSADGAGTSDF